MSASYEPLLQEKKIFRYATGLNHFDILFDRAPVQTPSNPKSVNDPKRLTPKVCLLDLEQ
jgi:hypothetical protein